MKKIIINKLERMGYIVYNKENPEGSIFGGIEESVPGQINKLIVSPFKIVLNEGEILFYNRLQLPDEFKFTDVSELLDFIRTEIPIKQ